jgi:hypothetical protein
VAYRNGGDVGVMVLDPPVSAVESAISRGTAPRVRIKVKFRVRK